MTEWLREGWLLDLVIGLTLLELITLIAYRWRTGRGIAHVPLIATMASGLWLMVALKAALVQAAWPWVVLPLMAAGLAHAADLRGRWQR